MILTTFEKLVTLLSSILEQEGLDSIRATECARIFAANTRDGVASHGVNRFQRFVNQIRGNVIDIKAIPVFSSGFECFEQWDGCHGIGPLNAIFAIDRAMELATLHGMGVVALRNTTHWMRGATYGWRAALKGFPCICWTNTTANMPPWGGKSHAIGNNPLVMAIPSDPHPIVLDMAMSQYSYGKLESLKLSNEQLPYPGGFNHDGMLSTDPQEILETKRVLPIGMWKGSGLSIMLDLFAATLSSGSATAGIPVSEPNLSQMFVAFHPGKDEQEKLARKTTVETAIRTMQDMCRQAGEHFPYPGEGTVRKRTLSEEDGIYVNEQVWQNLVQMLPDGIHTD